MAPIAAVQNSPLPPSVEKAYHQKCIALKRRLREIEEANDAARLRKHRLDRSITKMRITRAFLLEQLVKSQEYDDAESDKSSTPPPTPRDRPPRAKRTYQRRSPPPNGLQNSVPTPPPAAQPPFATPGIPYGPQSQAVQHILAPARPPLVTTSLSHHSQGHNIPLDHRSPVASLTYPRELPLIMNLPNGTSVMLVGPNEPKRAPWTIRDLGPQHQINPDFDLWPAEAQEREIFKGENGPYLPYDVFGNAVSIEWDEALGKYKHIFADSPAWKNPVANGIRMDTPEHGRRPIVAERRAAAAAAMEAERLAAERLAAERASGDREQGQGQGQDGITPPAAARRDSRNGVAAAAAPAGASGGGGFTAVNR